MFEQVHNFFIQRKSLPALNEFFDQKTISLVKRKLNTQKLK